ncbi:Uncharacterised protein [Candidatus Gugararchaeum adminiculabundum]|nr:Uncharacterised protein [Candidatus Gugararchaeum adminiculabundum]
MNKIAVLVILVLLVAGAVYLIASPKAGLKSEEDAKTFMTEYLKGKFPDADEVGVFSIEKKGTNYQIKARVSYGLTTECPRRYHFLTTYPETGITSEAFVLPPRETIVGEDCKICQGKPQCLISYEEEAIVASHIMPGSERINQFIAAYSDASASANFRDDYNGLKNVWLVRWNSKEASMPVTAVISKDSGQILSVE